MNILCVLDGQVAKKSWASTLVCLPQSMDAEVKPRAVV